MRIRLDRVLLAALLSAALFCAACLKVAPYQRPPAAPPPEFKEGPPSGWIKFGLNSYIDTDSFTIHRG